MRRSSWVALIGALVLLGLFAWTTLRSTHVECEVCVNYRGLKECATGAGPTRVPKRHLATLRSKREVDLATAMIVPGMLSLGGGRRKVEHDDGR